jgi:uncharacterized membrane-anchored protein YjiN (DUF445 family)
MAVSGVSPDDRQAARLRRSRAVAGGLLVLAAAMFVGTLLVPDPGGVVLLLRAVAEAALVGGLADWFAVTALFRRPLGLPIPHTAIVPANRDRIGEGLARFLNRYVLAPELLRAELRAEHRRPDRRVARASAQCAGACRRDRPGRAAPAARGR